MTNLILVERKNAAYVGFNSQLQDSLHFAIMEGKEFILKVRPTTRLSGPLKRATDAGWIKLENLHE